MKEKLQKVKNFAKEHKVDIAYFGGLILGAYGTVILSKIINRKAPYSTAVYSDNKEYIDGLTHFFNSNPGKRFTGAAIATNKTAEEIGNITIDFIGKVDADEYLYNMILEKIKKSDI